VTVRVESVGAGEHGGLPLIRVVTDELELTFAPTRGGRLLSLVHGGRELLWRDPALLDGALRPVVPVSTWPAGDGGMSTWANVGGSKTWPAPQGWSGPDEWAGPPDPVLDSGTWSASWTVDESVAVVTLTSPDDPRSGLRVTRRFTVRDGSTRLDQHVTFENVSSTTRRWAIWEVCQADTAGGAASPSAGSSVVVPHDRVADELDLGTYEGELPSGRRGHDVVLPLGTGVAKRGYPGASGSVALHDEGGPVLALSTTPAPAGTWPDGGAKVEVWLQRPTAEPIASLEGLHPSAHLVELEVLGPLETLQPGDASTLEIEWRVGPA